MVVVDLCFSFPTNTLLLLETNVLVIELMMLQDQIPSVVEELMTVLQFMDQKASVSSHFVTDKTTDLDRVCRARTMETIT